MNTDGRQMVKCDWTFGNCKGGERDRVSLNVGRQLGRGGRVDRQKGRVKEKRMSVEMERKR
jgi:hypothetical protein